MREKGFDNKTMSVLLLATIFLLYTSKVISNCPPDSGIYLMFNGSCYTNGSYINHIYITPGHTNYSPLQCVLPNSTLSGGELVYPNGQSVNCNSNNYNDPLRCIESNNPANITVFRPDGQGFYESSNNINNIGGNKFKCCLPSSCSDPTTNIITVHIFKHVEITDFSVVELPSNMTVVPQQYRLQCVQSGIDRNFRWYYVLYNSHSCSIEFNCLTHKFGYSCSNESQTIQSINNTIVHNLTVTWYAEKISSGIFSQSNNNGDHVHWFYVRVDEIVRNRYLIVTAPVFTPSPTLVNKTATTIIVDWKTPVPSDADGYVVNATSDTHIVTQQVKGGCQNKMTLKGLIPGATYNITIRAYQDILGPVGNVISVQTLSSVISSISWIFVSSISELQNTQYHINCITTTVNVSTDVYWLVNGVMKYNSMYTLLDSDLLIYNNTLLVYPDPLGVSVNVTCIAMYKGVNYSDTVILEVPSGPPSNVMAYILNKICIKVNWTMSSQTTGYVIVINSTTGVGGTNKILSSTEDEVLISGLTLSRYYEISVYSYKDLPSITSTQRLLRFDVPTPVTNLSVSDVTTTTITMNWTSPGSEDGNYVTYYNFSYNPSCPELSSVNVRLISVTPYQSTTTFSYTLRELFSGMNYTITVKAGNILGESSPTMILGEIDPTSSPRGSPASVMVFLLNKTSNKITWEEVDCHLSNGRIIEYIVMISNNSMTYNLTSSERYVIVNDLVFGNVYNMSITGVNSIGRGPFSNPVEVQIGTIPGPVSTLSSLMSTTWAVISWSVPSYIPVDYPIITYEIGYTTHQCDCDCSPSDEFSPMIKTNTSSINVNISDLIGNSCYLFGVRGYTVNGYGLWTVIGNITEQELTICTNEVTSSTTSTITILSVLVGILLIVVIISIVGNILQFIYNRRLSELITATSKVQQQTDSRPDEDIEMKVCEPYIIHQSRLTDKIYESVNHQ